ncbi:MAG: hypothetical protein FWE37_06705 [Spirochaetaceae bacterium]|nr:hypothetical protein [Spirochaetaceae bacterium]
MRKVILLLIFSLPLAAMAETEHKLSFVRLNYGFSLGTALDAPIFVNANHIGFSLMWDNDIYFPTTINAALLIAREPLIYGIRGEIRQTFWGLIQLGLVVDYYTFHHNRQETRQAVAPFVGLTLLDMLSVQARFAFERTASTHLLYYGELSFVFDVGAYIFLVKERKLSWRLF